MIGVRTVGVLKRHGYKWPPVKPAKGTKIELLIVISLGRAKLHDSGYPFIQVYGADKEKNLYDLNMHDHLWFRVEVDMDSLGANIFRFWTNRPMRLRSEPSTSTLEVTKDYEIW